MSYVVEDYAGVTLITHTRHTHAHTCTHTHTHTHTYTHTHTQHIISRSTTDETQI